jgi:hypothetical protein
VGHFDHEMKLRQSMAAVSQDRNLVVVTGEEVTSANVCILLGREPKRLLTACPNATQQRGIAAA